MLCAYGVDVLDQGTSLRRVWVLANRLPPWARSPGEPWSPESHLLALLIDHLAQLTWVTLQAAGAKGATRPQPLPRPPRQPDRASATAPGSQAPAAGGWAATAKQLAAIPGVAVSHG